MKILTVSRYLMVYPLSALVAAFLLSGCTVRTYSVVKDRVDQDTTGNQGYLTGSAPSGYQKDKKFTQRTTKVVEIELTSPVKIEKLKNAPKTAQESFASSESASIGLEQGSIPEPSGLSPEIYVVQKNDTLQKISARLYGTTKKWMKIYEANKDKLSAPDKIYPGQELRLPIE